MPLLCRSGPGPCLFRLLCTGNTLRFRLKGFCKLAFALGVFELELRYIWVSWRGNLTPFGNSQIMKGPWLGVQGSVSCIHQIFHYRSSPNRQQNLEGHICKPKPCVGLYSQRGSTPSEPLQLITPNLPDPACFKTQDLVAVKYEGRGPSIKTV